MYWKGNKLPVDGTSASTPAMAQMISMFDSLLSFDFFFSRIIHFSSIFCLKNRMNSERLNANLPTLGFANPFLYSAWATNPASFVDVTDGATQVRGEKKQRGGKRKEAKQKISIY